MCWVGLHDCRQLCPGQYRDHVGGNYRMIFLWAIGWYSVAAVAMYIVCRGWKQHGGVCHYTPPPLPDYARFMGSKGAITVIG